MLSRHEKFFLNDVKKKIVGKVCSKIMKSMNTGMPFNKLTTFLVLESVLSYSLIRQHFSP